MPKATTGTKGETIAVSNASSKGPRNVTSTVVVAAKTAGSPGSRSNRTSTAQSTAAKTIEEKDNEAPKKCRASIQAALETLEEDTMDQSWYEVLKSEFSKPYFKKLKKFLEDENVSHEVYPPMEQIYSWSRYTPLNQVKVVVLGQDPYHNVGQAHGLSFSVLPPTKTPGSLRNIYKQLSTDIPGFSAPSSGDLSPVATLGVLWLNASLTVRAHKAGSHSKKGWETFTAEVIRKVLARCTSEHPQGVVFMAWGLPAQKTYAAIGIDETKHLVLKSPHPSPLSAHRGFLGNEHFKTANEWLELNYGAGSAIDWKVLSVKSN